jgi:hypothetical protein
LILAFKQLYEELLEKEPSTLLNVKKPAFQFVTADRFQQAKYDISVCEAVQTIANEYKHEVVKMLKVIMPALATAFKKQKGEIFGFGEKDQEQGSQHALSRMNKEKLEKAPIHNLDAERSVGFINFELSRRGAKQLGSASSSHIKCKAKDLIENAETGSYKRYGNLTKTGSVISELYIRWRSKQEELKKKGLEDKEIANLAVDRRKNEDLQSLKAMKGPFTSSKEVDEYIATEADSYTKLRRLYLEVRYARDTSLSLPKSSDIFRLLKDHQKLPIETYVTNLKLYLDNIVSNASVTMEDLHRAIESITHLETV